MEAANSWADLGEDLLDQIFRFLPSFADRAVCTGVCRHWRSCAMQQEHAAQPMLPWVLRPSTAGASYFRIFSKTTTDEPPIPENARSARFLGSSPGSRFIIARGQWRGYALLNLITGDEVPLPDGAQDEVPLPDGAQDEVPDELQLQIGIEPSALLILAATVSPALPPDNNYFIAGITLGHHKVVIWTPGMDGWWPVKMPDPAELWKMSMREEYEDVIYYRCQGHGCFYFLTSQERLLVLRIVAELGDMVCYNFFDFPDHQMTSPPEAGQNVAGRYLVQSGTRLLMVKRFSSPLHGTMSFQVFCLQWRNHDPSWQRVTTLTGILLFIGRGCSRAFQTGRSRPGHIYFLDDAEVFLDPWSIVRTEKQYRCSDAGWCSYVTQYVKNSWPPGNRPHSSPWIWLFH